MRCGEGGSELSTTGIELPLLPDCRSHVTSCLMFLPPGLPTMMAVPSNCDPNKCSLPLDASNQVAQCDKNVANTPECVYSRIPKGHMVPSVTGISWTPARGVACSTPHMR